MSVYAVIGATNQSDVKLIIIIIIGSFVSVLHFPEAHSDSHQSGPSLLLWYVADVTLWDLWDPLFLLKSSLYEMSRENSDFRSEYSEILIR